MTDRIFGHTWDAIQRAQRGGRLHDTVDTSKPVAHDATDADRALLIKHGAEELARMQYWGALDRLRRSGMLP